MIVTQAPLTGTSRDFWRMVWEQRTAVVVAMTTAEEKWWPEGHGGQQRHSLVVGRSWADGKQMNDNDRYGLDHVSLVTTAGCI